MRISKLVWKTIARIAFYLGILLLIGILILQIRPVQTYLTKQFLEGISTKTDHQISVESIKIAWFDRVAFHDLLILDRHLDTLVYANDIVLNYELMDLMNKNFLSVEEVSSTSTMVNLIKHDSLSQLNVSEFLSSLSSSDKKSNKGIRVHEINFQNLQFRMQDRSKEEILDKIDFAHLDVLFSDFLIGDLEVKSDSIEMNIVQIRGEERKGLEIVDFRSNVELNNHLLSLTGLNFDTETSHISDSIKLYYNGLSNLSHFVDSVSFGFYLSESKISKEDLDLIIGENSLKSGISFDGIFWGTVGDFNMEQSRIGFGNESFIEGGVSCFGLPNLKSTFALADITDSHIAHEDIEPYVGQVSQNLAQLGKVDFTGSFAGFLNDFVARGDFITEKGSIHSDINLKIPDDAKSMSYSGNLELRDVDMGAFLNDRDLVQNVNLKGNINGSGITRGNANFSLNAIAFNTGVKGYVYDSIKANGTFASNFFKGSFSVDDPNCKVNGYADLDLNLDEEIMKISLEIDSTRLDQINLISDSILTGGKVNIDITDLDIDKFSGVAKIDSAFVQLNDKKTLIDSIRFRATQESDGGRRFKLDLPGLDAQLDGKFKISDALKDLSGLASDYSSKIQMVKDSIHEERSGASYKMELVANIDNLSRYLDSLNIPIEIPDGSYFEATFRESKNANIQVYAEAEYIRVGNHTFHNPVLEANGSKQLGSSGILTNFILVSDKQEFAGISETEDLLLEGIWFNDNIDFTTSIIQEESESDVRFETNVKLSPDSILVKMKPSAIKIFGDKWEFNTANLISIHPNYIDIENLEIHSSTESIGLTGIYSNASRTELALDINHLSLDKANLFTDFEIEGSLDGKMNIFRDSYDQGYQFDGGFLASHFTLNEFLVGDINGNAKWNPQRQNIYSTIEVDRENFRSINLSGYYFPLESTEQLDFDLRFDKADLRIVKPFVEENISNLRGFASGELEIDGSLSHPTVTGHCAVSNGNLTLNYLNTSYLFEGKMNFEPTYLVFEDFQLEDRKGSISTIEGGISHESFKNFVTDISLNASNFEFLNTTSIDNSLYYGSANGTGKIDISGPLNDLNIKASIRTNQDTRFFVPITEGGDISQQEYISFVDLSDSTQIDLSEDYSLRGLTLDFDIEVTPDAYCELIFDIKTGDIIRGRGRGNIKLTLDTDGEFHMFGPLEITEGAYNFTVPGFINKEFQVTPGSRITWFGDPYNAIIDLDAAYLQRASFEELKTAEEQDESELSNKVPVNVLLNLDGSMLAPNIDFDLQLQDDIDATEDRNALLAQIINDEQELRRQVISLLFFKRFSPRSSFAIGGGGNLGNSLSEFFSSQVSYLVSQLDENLEVEVDLASLDQNAFNTFQLRLAYTFLGGRLKITRGGGFSNDQNSNDRVIDNIVGDWSVEYSLTKDGRLRAKVFSATNRQITSTQSDQSQDRGISLRFVHSFNDFRDLLSLRREEGIKRREEEQETYPQPGN